MSAKQLVQQVMSRMPDDASIDDVLLTLELVASVHKAETVAQSECIPHEVVRARAEKWGK